MRTPWSSDTEVTHEHRARHPRVGGTAALDRGAARHRRAGISALLTGGRRDERTGSLVGPLACLAAAQVHATLFVTSAAAVHPAAGSLEMTLEEAEVKRIIANAADDVALAVASSKLGAG